MPRALFRQVHQVALLEVAEHLCVRDTAQPVGHGFETGHLLPSLEGDVGIQVPQGVLVQSCDEVHLGCLHPHFRISSAALELAGKVAGGHLALPHLSYSQGQVADIAL